jgi:hypothetical protein
VIGKRKEKGKKHDTKILNKVLPDECSGYVRLPSVTIKMSPKGIERQLPKDLWSSVREHPTDKGRDNVGEIVVLSSSSVPVRESSG